MPDSADCFLKMNALTHLFHRFLHPAPKTTPHLCSWRGDSGKEYEYQIRPLNAEFRPLAGNYIYAKETEEGGWIPIFIAQTRDLHQRLEGHVRLSDAVAHGATHLHAHYCAAGQASRCEEERDLIKYWQPECNEVLES